MRDITVALAYDEARMTLVDEESGDELLLAARRLLLAGRSEEDHEIGDIGMADEVLNAVYDEIIAVANRRTFHTAHIRTRARLGHRETVRFFTPHRRKEIFLAL